MADADLSKKSIRTQRLTLREARRYDLTALHELFKGLNVIKHWSQPHSPISRTKSYLETMVSSSTTGDLAFVVVLNPSTTTKTSSKGPVATPLDEGVVIGYAGLWYPEANELLFMLARPYWKQGYMSEELEALIPLFWQRGLKMVFADVVPGSEASIRLLWSLGFRHVGQNIVECAEPNTATLRMELVNPSAGVEEGGGEGEGGGSDGRAGNDR